MTFGAPLQRDEFAKYSALGNDYLVVDGDTFGPLDSARVQAICHRHHGVGSDGILVRTAGRDGSTVGLRIFNPDGSEAEKSGNGLRIFARFLYDFGYAPSPTMTVHTAGGVVTATLHIGDGHVTGITVEMGRASFEAVGETLDVDGEKLTATIVSVGNPHCVILVPTLDVATLHRLGPRIETHPRFPKRTNVQFAQVVNRNHLSILIWERGAGETMASGSSSCAAAAAAVRNGVLDRNATVSMPGGTLQISMDDTFAITMRGPATPVCRGRAFL